jgi:hypothetical protein
MDYEFSDPLPVFNKYLNLRLKFKMTINNVYETKQKKLYNAIYYFIPYHPNLDFFLSKSQKNQLPLLNPFSSSH